jgi:hypothetical protein
MLSITAALISLGLCYALRVEYFKVFAFVYALTGSVFAFFGRSPVSSKLREAGVFLGFGGVIYLVACLLWK